MKKIINLTQHSSTLRQQAVGVVELKKEVIRNLLTFHHIPDEKEISDRAIALAEIAKVNGFKTAMIGGAPYLMGELERELKKRGIQPLYAFSERISEEVEKDDGSIEKVTKFKHLGFVKK